MEPRRKRDSKGRVLTSGVGDVCGTLTTYLRRKAKERNLEWNLSEQYLWDLFLEQGGCCAISGVGIKLTTKINKHRNLDRTILTASLDRIDSGDGYVEGNVQWTHKTVNTMKQSLPDNEFINWCVTIANYANPELSAGNDAEQVPVKVQRLGGEDIQTNNPPTSAQHPRPIRHCRSCNTRHDASLMCKCFG